MEGFMSFVVKNGVVLIVGRSIPVLILGSYKYILFNSTVNVTHRL